MSRSVEMGRRTVVNMAALGVLALGAVTVSATSAEAQNRLNFTGSANLVETGFEGSELFIDFLTDGTAEGGPTGTVGAIETISGDFDPEIMAGTQGLIRDFTVDAEGLVGGSVSEFLTIGGYTFTLTGTEPGNAFGPISLVPLGPNTAGFFAVSGTVTGGDFGTTSRTFTGLFTTNFANRTPADVFAQVDNGQILPVSFSAEFNVADAQVVPEPATVVLLGSGILGLGLFGLRRRNSTQA
jgi:hypothetical protein